MRRRPEQVAQPRLVHAEVVDEEALEASRRRRRRPRRCRASGRLLLRGDDRRTARSRSALSPSVAARHSAMPARSVRWAAALMPVPGLLNARNVVVPPNAARHRVLVKKRSGSSSDGMRACVWTSTTPGRTSRPVASTTSLGGWAGMAGRDAATIAAVRRIRGRPPPRPSRCDRDDRCRRGPPVEGPRSITIVTRPRRCAMGCAPSQRTRRPSSGSCSRPSVSVRKWLPQSWPTLLEKSTLP